MNQQHIVLCIVAVALLYLGRKGFLAWRGIVSGSGCGGCGCKPVSNSPVEKAASAKQVE